MSPSPRARRPLDEVQAFLAPYPAEVRATVLALRRLVFAVAPRALEQIDLPAKLLAYGFARTYNDTLCVIMPLKAAVNLGFPRGVDLPDPAGLLAGAGKRARHVKLTDPALAKSPRLRDLLEAALAEWRARQP